MVVYFINCMTIPLNVKVAMKLGIMPYWGALMYRLMMIEHDRIIEVLKVTSIV